MNKYKRSVSKCIEQSHMRTLDNGENVRDSSSFSHAHGLYFRSSWQVAVRNKESHFQTAYRLVIADYSNFIVIQIDTECFTLSKTSLPKVTL